jgi:hypothetical protein
MPRGFMKRFLFYSLLPLFTACIQAPTYSVTTTAYVGPGFWNVSLVSDGTFHITESSSSSATLPDLDLYGTYNRTSSGFDYLFVEQSASPSGKLTPPVLGASTIALEIPNVAFFMTPFSGPGVPVPMLLSGACPAAAFSANGIVLQQSSTCGNPSTGTCGWTDVLGFTPAGNLSFPTIYNFARAPISSQSYAAASCTNGIIQVGGAQFFLSPNGVSVVLTNVASVPANQTLLTLPQQTLNFPQFTGTYSGLFYSGVQNSVVPVSLTLDITGTIGNGSTFSDVQAPTLGSTAFALQWNNISLPNPGTLSATITESGAVSGAGNFNCIAGQNLGSSQNVIQCAGQDPASNGQSATLLLVSLPH